MKEARRELEVSKGDQCANYMFAVKVDGKLVAVLTKEECLELVELLREEAT